VQAFNLFQARKGQVSCSAMITCGLMGYKTPNIHRIAREGMRFTDLYAEQSCAASFAMTARRAAEGAGVREAIH
jgi:arylsulfatase A-like enzyme